MTAPTALQRFRSSRKSLGFVHTSAYIPVDRREEFAAYVLRMRGEHTLKLAETLDSNSEELDMLGTGNHGSMPSTAKVFYLMKNQFAGHRELLELCKELLSCINKSEAATASMEFITDYNDRLRCRAKAIGHSTIAEATWKEVTAYAKEANITITSPY